MAKQDNDMKSAEDAKRETAPGGTATETAGGAISAGAASAKSQATTAASQDAIALLKADHRKVEQLFAQYEAADDGGDKKSELIRQVCSELVIHTLIEEEIFYPACRQAASDEDSLDEAQVEHDSAKMLIADLMRGDARDEYRDAKVKVLSEQIKHHVAEEEKLGSGIFAMAQAANLDLQQLGQRLQQRKQALQQDAQDGDLPPSRPVSFQPGPTGPQQKENTMPRGQYDRDRDERGRFTDDDDRGSRGYAAQRGGESRSFSNRDDDDDRRYGSRSSNDRDRDDRGRFVSDDDDRGSRGYGARGSNDRDRDSRGRFTDDGDRGSSSRGSNDRDRDDRGRFTSEDDGYSSRGRSSRDDDQGYSSRGSNDRDRDSRGRFTDDDRGDGSQGGGRDRDSRGRYASDDDDDRRYGARGGDDDGRGWYGDPQGHSEASRRGWAERNGGARARSDDDDDRRGGSRSRGQDDDNGRGQGGWFGDSRGHAEAARRGWQDRR